MAVSSLYILEARKTLDQCYAQIKHCVDQLPEDDIWWRPFELQNAVGNILLHLCGNLRQWIVCGVGGAPDTRDRPAEFAQRERIPKADLMRKLQDTVREADEAMSRCDEANLLRERHVQHGSVTGLGAIFHSVSHFYGHTQEIIYITRLRLGDLYRFRGIDAKSR